MSEPDFLPGLRADVGASASPAGGADSERGREALRDGHFGEAAECFERAIAHDPTGGTADLLGLAEARLWQGRHADAERACRELLGRDPSQRDARAILGIALANQDDPEEAVRYLLKAPDHPAVHLGMALAMERLGRFGEAEQAARRALALAADFPGGARALGTALAHQRRHTEAIVVLGRALKLEPEDALTRLALGRVRLALGQAEAWPEIDWRLKLDGFLPEFPPAGPPWDGSPPAGKTILLIAEPDPGDQILFVRYASSLKAAGARVVLGCRPESVSLLSRADGVDRVVTDPAMLDGESVDAHAFLMSLPGLLKVAPGDSPRPPYFRLDPASVARWSAEVAALPGHYKVAVHWGGGGAGDRGSVPPDEFARLAVVPGVHLIAVQPTPGAAGVGFPMTDFGPALAASQSPMVETAAFLRGVDLLVTDDAPLAHLAGSIDVPTWVALPVGPDWRWMADGTASPWYPRVRLFRQDVAGDWSGVFAAMTSMLRAGAACREAVRRLTKTEAGNLTAGNTDKSRRIEI